MRPDFSCLQAVQSKLVNLYLVNFCNCGLFFDNYLFYANQSWARSKLNSSSVAFLVLHREHWPPTSSLHCNPVQGQYREPLFSLQGPCFHYRDFPVRKTSQENPVFIRGMGLQCGVQVFLTLFHSRDFWIPVIFNNSAIS